MNHPANPARILAYDHIGIRVSDKSRAINFYQSLGFVESASFPQFEANEMLSVDGVRINLIFNGTRTANAHNALLDEPIKLPGITHPAFIVDDLQRLQTWLGEQGIRPLFAPALPASLVDPAQRGRVLYSLAPPSLLPHGVSDVGPAGGAGRVQGGQGAPPDNDCNFPAKEA